MERLGFTNIRLKDENMGNNMTLQKIEADYSYSRNKTAIKEGKLDELRS
jgi:hypothetical protein